MTAEGPKAGLTHSRSLIVDASVIVSAALLGPLTDMPPVVATACRVALVEATCFDALKPVPEAGGGPWVPMSISAMWQRRPRACG